MSPSLTDNFPQLGSSDFKITSLRDRRYNCVAWAAGDQKRWWWPDLAGCAFWPAGVPREQTTAAFIAAFQSLGFTIALDGDLEINKTKIVLYASDGRVTHAARQFHDGNLICIIVLRFSAD